jgi:hypothetical protein
MPGRRGVRRALALAAACAVWASAAGPVFAQELLDRVMARVGTTSIMLTDVTAALGLGLVETAAGVEPQAAATLQLIDRELMLIEVARFRPAEPVPDAVDREAAMLRARAGAGLERLMQATGLDDARIRDIARDNLRIQAYLTQRFGATVQVSDEDVLQYYRANETEFTRNGKLIPFEEAEPLARQRTSARRRSVIISQWLDDLRGRGSVTLPQSRP